MKRYFSLRAPLRYFVVLFLCFAHSTLRAQVDRGTIVGAVSDSTGAVVPGATITILNVETNQSVKLATDNSGAFIANLLRIGTYKVSAEKEGFRKTEQAGVEVGVNQVVRVDLVLQVGAVTQTVEVSAAPPLIQSEASSLGTIETERRIVDLPLNGRNFIALAYLGPGASPGVGVIAGSNNSGQTFETARANEALSVNGLRVTTNNFLLDGLDNNEYGNGGVVALPPPDALQEFRIEENSMSAQFGRGGAAVNVALKSGTNEVHGGAYEFVRNDKFDARNFFDVNRAPFRRNQFGFFVGGPIKKDKTFIFGDYQGTRIREGVTEVSTIPNASERAGDFTDRLTGKTFSPCSNPGAGDPVFNTGAIFDPTTTRNFTCSDGTVVPIRDQFMSGGQPNVLPAGAINQVGQNVVNLYPMPNLPTAGLFNNYLLNPKLIKNESSFDVRVDQRLSDSDQFFGHYTFDNLHVLLPAPLGDLGGADCCPSRGVNGAQSLGLGWTHTLSPTLLNDFRAGYFRYLVIANPLNFGKNLSVQLGIPNSNRGDPTSSGLSTIDVAGFTGLGDSLWTPEFAAENIYQFAETLSWVRGKHSMKLGIDFRRQQRNFFQTTAPRGWFSFSGNFTNDLTTSNGGNGLADVLLGIPQFEEQDALKGRYPTRYWDLAGFAQDDFRVTPDLTLNLGLRYQIFSPANGRIGNFDLARAIVVNAEGPNGVPHAGVQFDKNDWSPRLGFAWTPFGNKRTVVRSAFGIFYSGEGNIFDDLGLSPPYLSVNSQFFSSGNIPSPDQYISSGFPPTVSYPDPSHPFGTVRANGPKRLMPRIMEWNFSVQRQVAENWMVQLAYVGTRAYRLWNHESSDLNQPLVPLDSNFSDPTGNMGRPFFNVLPDLVTILPLDFAQLDLIYHSFQASVNRRFANGFNLMAAYTFAKNLGTADGNVGASIQNAHNISELKGPVPHDVRHRATMSYLYEMPVGQGKRFLGNATRALDLILGGWQASGITTLQSGLAFNAGLSSDLTNTGSPSPRPDRIHDPSDFTFDTATQASLGCTPGKQTLTCFWNQAAFTIPPLAPGQLFAHQFGNGGSGNLRGPELINFDLAMLKSFRITERHQLQFRAELFNIFNTPNFSLPGGGVDFSGGASISSTIPDNQREIQFALKWIF